MRPGEVRTAVILRDTACMARGIDPKAGPCHDRWGRELPDNGASWDDLEADYVRLRSHAGRHEDPRDHVTLCPGHHQGTGAQQGYVWATAHRAEMRAWLEERG